jgi:hypothetical protein
VQTGTQFFLQKHLLFLIKHSINVVVIKKYGWEFAVGAGLYLFLPYSVCLKGKIFITAGLDLRLHQRLGLPETKFDVVKGMTFIG